jgi:hypothetical protein
MKRAGWIIVSEWQTILICQNKKLEQVIANLLNRSEACREIITNLCEFFNKLMDVTFSFLEK